MPVVLPQNPFFEKPLPYTQFGMVSKAALYFHTLGLNENERTIIQKTYQHCRENGNEFVYLYKDAGLQKPLFNRLQEDMKKRNFHILYIPSLLQIHCAHMGHTLTFLRDAYECGIDIVCLQPIPTYLFQQHLTLTPRHSHRRPFDLEDTLRYLRHHSRYH